MPEQIIYGIKPPVPFPRSYWVVPGLFLAGEYPGNVDLDVTEKKIAAMIDLGIRHVIDLMESDEIHHTDGPASHYEELLVNIGASRQAHVSHVRFQVVDYNVPTPDRMRSILDNIDSNIAQDRPVYIHCWGGLGRTGTAIGCFLLRHGLATSDNVIDIITRLRQNDPYVRRISPQNEKQVEFVKSWPTHESGTPSRLNRYVGCMLGGAAGDALGAPVEFLGTDDIRNIYGDRGINDFDNAYGRPGAITDDTQMTMFTAEGLLRSRAEKPEPDRDHVCSALHASYVRWLNTQGISSRSPYDGNCQSILIPLADLHNQRAPGKSCISALRKSVMGTVSRPINNSKGCGGIMRTAPIGLMAADTGSAFEIACDAAAITHGHPSGYLAAGAFSAIIHEIKTGVSLMEAIHSAIGLLRNRREHEECLEIMEKAIELSNKKSPSPETIRTLGAGWVAEEALSIAIYCALCAKENFETGVLLAVNHDGDSDSTGSITGNILGTLLGSTAIPEKWKNRLELANVIEKLAVDLFIGYREAQWWQYQYGESE